ncbi:flavin reductase family protein [Listeria costaricensis]|uniref:flavin reductase family protein n=1 Tax=Listeria costaricensis TaxID=2026604 RepID=UPI000C087EEA|nr:flavin reductase family protein [Listeria costaricensis]
MHKKLNKTDFYYGFPVALMTTKNRITGKDHLTPISSTWTLNRSVVLGIGLDNQGFQNLAPGTDLTLNLPDFKLWRHIEKIAPKTGNQQLPTYKKEAGYTFHPDKFALGKFTKESGITVQTVRIAECPIQIEALVTNIYPTSGFAIIECRIQAIFVEETLLKDETHLDTEKWQPLIYKFRSYTTTTESLGQNFKYEE